MDDPDFLDFMMEGGYVFLLFPDDEAGSFKCSFCGRVIQGNEKVVWIDKNEKKFKCPGCGEKIDIK